MKRGTYAWYEFLKAQRGKPDWHKPVVSKPKIEEDHGLYRFIAWYCLGLAVIAAVGIWLRLS